MTQAYNLSQLANNLNSSGQLDATDGLVNSVPVANGGTGATSSSAARTNLGLVIGTDVPSPTGAGASGTWGISVSGNAATATNASYASSAGNGGVTSVNGLTGAVSIAVNSTSNVLAATAGASVGDVGTYAYLSPFNYNPYELTPGTNISASYLYYASSPNNVFYVAIRPSGTWKCMGYIPQESPSATVFLRVA